MFLRKYALPLSVLLIAMLSVGLYYLKPRPPKDPITIIKPVEVEKKPVAPKPPPPGESFETGHWHGDEWHTEPHEAHQPVVPPPIPDDVPGVSAPLVQIPEGITDPQVLAAWQRVDYIANNLWEWGGVANPETPGLIAKLMPPPAGFSGPTGHSDIEETFDLLGRLDPNDPRSIEVMATYFGEGLVGGLGPEIALANMGVPAVPYVLPYMFDMERSPLLRSRAILVLGRIGEMHREDLDGIVEHIIIPRLEAILAQENPEYNEGKYARESLSRLK